MLRSNFARFLIAFQTYDFFIAISGLDLCRVSKHMIHHSNRKEADIWFEKYRYFLWFQIFELNVNCFDLETCQKAAIYLKKLTSVRLRTLVNEGQEFDVENAVECLKAFINNGKLRWVSFKISTENTSFEDAQLWRQKLMQHPDIKKWSKVIRIRCELFFAK